MNNEKVNFSLMPNPNKGVFSISVQTNSQTNFDLIIFDSKGQKIKNEKIEVNGQLNKTIDLSGIEPGVYMLMLRNANARSMQKMIVL